MADTKDNHTRTDTKYDQMCNCGSSRVALLTAKCSDCCGISVGTRDMDGYVPNDMGIGGGDYVTFEYCLDCGKIAGNFPLPQAKLEHPLECQLCGESIPIEQAVEDTNNVCCKECA